VWLDQLIKPSASVVLGKPFFNGAYAKQTTTKNESGGATFRDPPFDGAATDRIGEVLFYAPRDESGLWIEPVCEVLDAADGEGIMNGLTTEVFNSRGAFWFTAGKAERDLAEEWDKKASISENKGTVGLPKC
jgi:hypothetical protein